MRNKRTALLIALIVLLLSVSVATSAAPVCEPGYVYPVLFIGPMCIITDIANGARCLHCGEEIVVWG